jgi:hypothetical protein
MEQFRQCLNKLAATPPRRKAALIRSLLPGIETALRCGHGLKEIWVALEGEGLQMSYRVFHKTVSRSRNAKKPTATSSWGKQDKPLEAREPQGTKVEAVEERDPLANLRRLEPENRPGFHWRGTRDVKTLVHGTADSNDKSIR